MKKIIKLNGLNKKYYFLSKKETTYALISFTEIFKLQQSYQTKTYL